MPTATSPEANGLPLKTRVVNAPSLNHSIFVPVAVKLGVGSAKQIMLSLETGALGIPLIVSVEFVSALSHPLTVCVA